MKAMRDNDVDERKSLITTMWVCIVNIFPPVMG